MSTRGAMGFHVNGEDKIAFNHWDSYPSGLGVDIIKDLRMIFAEAGWKAGAEWMKAKASKIRMVDDGKPATLIDQKTYRQYADTDVSTKQLSEWYVLLRKLQGKLFGQLNAGVMIDDHNFLADSLFCEWAYIVNCDENKLEIYRGFQHNPHSNGRYASLKLHKYPTDSVYYPVALVKEIPFDSLPKDGDNSWVEELENEGDEN